MIWKVRGGRKDTWICCFQKGFMCRPSMGSFHVESKFLCGIKVSALSHCQSERDEILAYSENRERDVVPTKSMG